jgi:hypothetical protein
VKHESRTGARSNATILPQAFGIGRSLGEGFMPVFRLPLSGNVTQSINPWNWIFNPSGGQFGLVNIALGQSSNPAVEEEVLSDVASYGKQLGRIEDALSVLLAHFRPERALSADEEKALAALKEMTDEIAAVKAKHGAEKPPAPLPKSRRKR